MNQDDKAKYLKIGMALCNVPITIQMADRVVHLYEGILKKKGEFSISDAIDVETFIQRKYADVNPDANTDDDTN